MTGKLVNNEGRISFAERLDDILSQILLMTEKIKYEAWKSNDEKSIKDISKVSFLISKLYDVRLELAENLIVLKN
jgi:hypothetical protein